MVYGRVHLDTEHPHIHLVISANEVGQSKKLRISQSRFKSIKKQMAALVERQDLFRNKAPEPRSPIADEKEKAKKANKIHAPLEQRKQEMKTNLGRCLQQSRTEAEFLAELDKVSLELRFVRKRLALRAKGSRFEYFFETLDLLAAYQVAQKRWLEHHRRRLVLKRIHTNKTRQQCRAGIQNIMRFRRALKR